MPDTQPNFSQERLVPALTAHASTLWGEEKAAQLHDSIAQTARMLHEIAGQCPEGDVEPACYPAAARAEEAAS